LNPIQKTPREEVYAPELPKCEIFQHYPLGHQSISFRCRKGRCCESRAAKLVKDFGAECFKSEICFQLRLLVTDVAVKLYINQDHLTFWTVDRYLSSICRSSPIALRAESGSRSHASHQWTIAILAKKGSSLHSREVPFARLHL